jgi:hypothetical protein
MNCHAGYNTEVEPGFNWKGSMMAQAARDFLFWTCMTVAAQDSLAVLGTPNAVDLCERCHFPKGWLEGRSDPPDVSAMVGADYDGVQCDFCHRMYDPLFQDTYDGIREVLGTDYWDEATDASPTAANETYAEDVLQSQDIQLFNGQPFFSASHRPLSPSYDENGSGQFFVSSNAEKRSSFVDAAARHRMLYSRHHKSKYFCGSCHDVSNPALHNLQADPSQQLPTELDPAYSYFHVERTFSEFMLSDYGQEGGSDGLGPFAPDVFETSLPDNKISRCQDCHMRDLVGKGANKKGVPVRPNESSDHPESGQPLHDLTGGNTWVSSVLASAVSGSPNYNVFNAQQLNQGPGVLTLDLTQGEGIDPVALLAGAERAEQQLSLAASIEDLSLVGNTVSFKVQNQTGHKLISGFPEGRRMFVNIKAYQGGALVYEVNPYDQIAGTLKGLEHNHETFPYNTGDLPAPLGLVEGKEEYEDELVYEMHPSSSVTDEDETFHFVLATGRYKDNRIPPKGFRIDQAEARMSVPVEDGIEKPTYFTREEYLGGYDDLSVEIPVNVDSVEVILYYQTTSREYVEFLRNEISGEVQTLPSEAYIAQTDPFFSGLRAWGETLWQLWLHNKDLPGASPFLMAEASAGGGTPDPTCTAKPPVLNSADRFS